jgi:hypothetical protein
MNDTKMIRLEAAIQKLKQEIMEMGDMRPGSLSRQGRRAKGKYGSYWHLSYTHQGKGRTQYVRDAFVGQIKSETRAFKQFRALVDRLVTLSIKRSERRMELQKVGASNQAKTR